eukprot:GEMP01004504.1.p1 GENE.GEMP01004504.1~~GEMP01004504.1.p1  ORF type:complete len:735 (+),score=206.07 GEMP01004504.1:201-2405(+)
MVGLLWLFLSVVASKRLRGIVVPEDEISQEDAIEKLPVTVQRLFLEAAKSKDVNKADEVMKELDKVYENTMMEKDLLDVDCKDKKEHFAVALQTSRALHQQSEASLTQIQNRMERTQMQSDSLQAQLQEHTHRYYDHKFMCEGHRSQSQKELNLLEKDLPLSKTLRETAAKGCTTLSLAECQQSDGALVVSFENAELKKMVANLTLEAQQLMSLNLERAVYGHQAVPKTSFFSVREKRHRRTLYGHQAELCKKVPTPPCEAFVDIMATFVGNVEDATDELRERIVMEDRKCLDDVQVDKDAVKVERMHIADLNVELSNAVEESEEAQAEANRKQKDWEDLSNEAKTAVGTCSRQLEDIDETLCGVRRLRKDLLKLGLGTEVPFIGDCMVTDWIRGPCTSMCNGGVQNLTREIVADAKLCPPLVVQRQCNQGPCPQDCKMGYWGFWSHCSKECGGGTQSRLREIEEEALRGGLPCGDTVQERLCNHQNCDQPCLLSEWSHWSGCSRVCLKGFQKRTRNVVMPARGIGHCPLESSRERRRTRRCNAFDCKNPVPKCNSTIDLVVALDSSGSVGAAGFAEAKGFLEAFFARFTDVAQIGLVDFATKAALAAPLGKKDAAITAAASVTWRKKNTNTAEALGLADEALLSGRQEAQSVVLIVTDGMPYSKYATNLMIRRLKDKAARVMFLTVGAAINQRVVKQWATWPWYDNVEKVPAYATLNATVATRVIVKMCPSLA